VSRIGLKCKPRANNRHFRGEKGVAGGGKPFLPLERFQGARSAVSPSKPQLFRGFQLNRGGCR
jgi:hypothetical protein